MSTFLAIFNVSHVYLVFEGNIPLLNIHICFPCYNIINIIKNIQKSSSIIQIFKICIDCNCSDLHTLDRQDLFVYGEKYLYKDFI